MASPLTFNPSDSAWRSWQCPPSAAPDYRIVGWLNEAAEEGQAWLKNQRGEVDFKKALDVISGLDTIVRQPSSDYRSKVNPNRLKRNIREIVFALSKLRPIWAYGTANSALKGNADMFNKILKSLYLEEFFDISICKALAYAAATATGWVNPVYRRDMYGTGKGHIALDTYGAPCVLPCQLPSDGDFQNAYAVTILKELPIAMAHGMFPQHQASLVPTESRYWYMHDAVRHSAKGNVWQRIAGKVFRQPGSEALADLLIPIRYTYVIDLSINTTKQPIQMGEPGASWSYTVPYIGQDIPVGKDKNGAMLHRKADENDARLYPYRRLLIADDKTKLYDGPGFDWHGMLPLAPFCLDSWPWEPIGFSLVHDAYELNEADKELTRGNMDKARAQLDMSLAYDTNAISEKEARALDPMLPRGRYGYDGNATEPGKPPFTPVVPEAIIKIDPTTLQFQKDMIQQPMDHQVALTDVVNLAKMRAVGSMDEIQKIMEANGPIIEGLSRSMEKPMRDIGEMVKYLILQYMPTSAVVQRVGATGMEMSVIDFDPTSLVPSHMPGEDPEQASPTARVARARNFADNLKFLITPGTLHEMSQMVMKLGLIQLKKAGVKISSQTIAEAWNISNYGGFGDGTEVEKFQAEQEADLLFAARMQAIGADAGLGQPPGGAAPGKQPEGRPATNAQPPQIKNKDGGARSTISTSG
jgi:hypothetical protein